MVIVGYKKVNFVNKEGKEVNGYRVHVAEPARTEYEKGMITDSFYLNDQKFEDYRCKDLYKSQKEIIVFYNKYGKIQALREV